MRLVQCSSGLSSADLQAFLCCWPHSFSLWMYPTINLVNAIFDRDVQHVPFHFHPQQHMLSVQSESFEMQIPLFEWSGDILIAPGYWQIIQHYCQHEVLCHQVGWLKKLLGVCSTYFTYKKNPTKFLYHCVKPSSLLKFIQLKFIWIVFNQFLLAFWSF